MAISKHEEKKQLSEDNERRDLEKNNFVFPPAYSRGKRKIQFPIGMDPKYVFNDYDIDDVNNDYNFYYKDEDENIKMQMRVYTEEYEGNPVEKARELYDNFCSRATEVLYQIEPKDEIDGQGMARTIVAGKFDYEDADTCVYYVGASDENRDYIMEFYYPDANPEYDYDDVNYILDCVYRYCSFAGGTYKPRSYEMFLQDDMGVKK